MNNLTLSITTIGDLLLRKTITNGEEPIKDVNLCVPIYQRPYKWTARNVIQLLDDIIDAKNSNKERYRVGTLILYKAKDKKQYDIVDGQQRTITFSLLLTALGGEGIEFLLQKIYDFLPDGLDAVAEVVEDVAALDVATGGEEAADDAGDVVTDVECLGGINTDTLHTKAETADARKDDGLAVAQFLLHDILNLSGDSDNGTFGEATIATGFCGYFV